MVVLFYRKKMSHIYKFILILLFIAILCGCHSPQEENSEYSALPFNAPAEWENPK